MPPDDFKKYLTTEILSEERIISYRTLARALKVHVNVAKCMLYEFQEQENKKKSGSLHATYLIAGVKKRDQEDHHHRTNGTNNGEDEPMPPSSPPPFTSSMLETSERGSQQQNEDRLEIPVKTITLLREEHLAHVKSQYDNITSIHIYSLSPHRIQDLVALTDTSRELYANHFVKEDPLIHNKTYGVIQNREVRRRKGRRPVIPQSAPVATKPQISKELSKGVSSRAATLQQTSAVKKEEPTRPDSSGSITSTAASTKGPALKRDGSDFFKKAFGFGNKAKPKPTTKIDAELDASTAPSASGTDTPDVKDESEGESEDSALFLDTGTHRASTKSTKKRSNDAKRERDDKTAKLRKMMDSDDEEKAVPDVEEASGIKPTTGEVPSDDAEGNEEEVAWSNSDSERKREQPETTITGPKRRRGKRKVMKKRTMKDEDGYLVTKEEAVWESFSESDNDSPSATAGGNSRPPPAMSAGGAGKGANKMDLKSQSKSGAGGAKTKTAGKGGDITSFFGKR